MYMYTYIYICTSTAADFTTQVCVGVCMDILHMCPRASQVCKCGCITFVYVLSHTFFPHMYLRGHVLYVWCVCLRNAIRLHMCTPPTHVHTPTLMHTYAIHKTYMCVRVARLSTTRPHTYTTAFFPQLYLCWRLLAGVLHWRIACVYVWCVCLRYAHTYTNAFFPQLYLRWRLLAVAYCMCVRLVRLFTIRPHTHKCIFCILHMYQRVQAHVWA